MKIEERIKLVFQYKYKYYLYKIYLIYHTVLFIIICNTHYVNYLKYIIVLNNVFF